MQFCSGPPMQFLSGVDIMIKVPAEYSTIEVKARLAEFILKAAARGQISYDGLVAAATDQINAIVGLFT